MSLRLLIDEDSQSRSLVNLLKTSGHNVLTVNDLDIAGSPDERVLECAQKESRVVLTRNCRDFEQLHKVGLSHSGIFVVYRNHEKSKDMNRYSIARAISNIEASGMGLKNQFLKLNEWNY